MTGLPQGVTLVGEGLRVHVLRDGSAIGSTVPAATWRDYNATTATGQRRTGFRTREAAVRWVCLQARPVVYQVRRLPSGRWSVTGPEGARACAATLWWESDPGHRTQARAVSCAYSLVRLDQAGVTR